MVEFTSQEAEAIKLSTHHQTILENYEGKMSEQVQVPEFSGCLTKKKKGLSASLCLSCFFSLPRFSLDWPSTKPLSVQCKYSPKYHIET